MAMDIPYTRDDWQIRFHEKKLLVINLPLHLREILDKRARGESKTFDTMELGLYLASVGFKGIWFSSGREQLEQPKKYLKYIIEHSYLKYLIADLLKESVTFRTGGELKLLNLTELNARSPRADFVIYDEESQADKDAYNAAVNILAGSDLGLIIHISTPVKASVFEENHDRLKLREIKTGEQFIFSRIWSDASWLFAKIDWYDEQKKVVPAWYFRQEHEASFELPMGAVFQNVEYGTYQDWLMSDIKDQPLCSGLDWNPVSGHWVVSVKFSRDMRNIVIMEEHDIGNGYAVDMNMDQFKTMAIKMSKGNRLVIESGGINEEYIKWFEKMLSETQWNWPKQQYSKEEWDSSGLNKLQVITFIIQNGITIYVDRLRFPNMAKMIEDCQWDSDSPEPKIKKLKSDSPHALDAFLHAISRKNMDDMQIELVRFYR